MIRFAHDFGDAEREKQKAPSGAIPETGQTGLSRPSRPDVDEKNNNDALPATVWHPLFALAINRFVLADRETSTEVSLSRLPQRVDIVVVKLEDVAPAIAHKFCSIFDYCRLEFISLNPVYDAGLCPPQTPELRRETG